MPLYTYECVNCKTREEHLVSLSDRDVSQLCPECGEVMFRIVDTPVIGKPSYQMKAILKTGEHVAGHFGKEAKKRGGKSS